MSFFSYVINILLFCNRPYSIPNNLHCVKSVHSQQPTLREKCPYSELFWSVFSRFRTEYEEILSIYPYSDRMRENTDQNNSE